MFILNRCRLILHYKTTSFNYLKLVQKFSNLFHIFDLTNFWAGHMSNWRNFITRFIDFSDITSFPSNPSISFLNIQTIYHSRELFVEIVEKPHSDLPSPIESYFTIACFTVARLSAWLFWKAFQRENEEIYATTRRIK